MPGFETRIGHAAIPTSPACMAILNLNDSIPKKSPHRSLSRRSQPQEGSHAELAGAPGPWFVGFTKLSRNVRALSGLPRKKKCGEAGSCGRGSFDRVV